jgi:hypothetical protein
VWIGQVRTLFNEDDVTQPSQTAAQADCGPVDCGNDGPRKAHHALNNPSALIEDLLSIYGVFMHLSQNAEVAARRESSSGTGEHHATAILVSFKFWPDFSQPAVKVLVGGVQGQRTVHANDTDRPIRGNGQNVLSGLLVARGRLSWHARTLVDIDIDVVWSGK